MAGCNINISNACVLDIAGKFIDWPSQMLGYLPIVGSVIAVARLGFAGLAACLGAGAAVQKCISENKEPVWLLDVARRQALTGLVELVPFVKLGFKIEELVRGGGCVGWSNKDTCALNLAFLPYITRIYSPKGTNVLNVE